MKRYINIFNPFDLLNLLIFHKKELKRVYDKVPEIQKNLFLDLPQTPGGASKKKFLEIPLGGLRGKKGNFVVHPLKDIRHKLKTSNLI